LIANVKEKTMANKKFWLGILVMVLVFGMTVVGCDDGSTGSGTDSALNGTWVDEHGMELKLDNGNFEVSDGGTIFEKGTYTTSGNNITITITHFDFGDGLKTKAQLLSAHPEDRDEIDAMFAPQTGNYSVNGNKLTMSQGGESVTYTRK
jgi:hypothetical protein